MFLKLKQKYENMYYFKEADRGEVDFVVQDGSKVIPYQVSLHGSEPRHEKALEHFYSLFPNAEESVFISLENAGNFL